jgi:hypothetical protein
MKNVPAVPLVVMNQGCALFLQKRLVWDLMITQPVRLALMAIWPMVIVKMPALGFWFVFQVAPTETVVMKTVRFVSLSCPMAVDPTRFVNPLV